MARKKKIPFFKFEAKVKGGRLQLGFFTKRNIAIKEFMKKGFKRKDLIITRQGFLKD